MNIQTTQLKSQKKQINEHSDWSIYFGMILKLTVLVILVFVIANFHIYLNQQIQTIEHENTKITRQIEDIDREIKYLQNKYEEASSWPEIRRQIVKFNLKLRPPEHSQIYYITLKDTDDINSYAAESTPRNDIAHDRSKSMADTDSIHFKR